jgi:ubiquinone/menaquinone biosynthesis C-methylase UbiE
MATLVVLFSALICSFAVYWLARVLAPQIYNAMIASMTTLWYRSALTAIPEGARILDVGIGTASALIRNAHIVRSRKQHIVGVDYDATYVTHALRALASSAAFGKGDVPIVCKSVYDESVLSAVNAASGVPADTLFDAVYFSGSFSLLPDQPRALRIAADLLRPGGAIYITQTFQRRHSTLLAAVKPWIKYLTTIDFGRAMVATECARIVETAGLRVVQRQNIAGSVDNALQSAILLICRPQ